MADLELSCRAGNAGVITMKIALGRIASEAQWLLMGNLMPVWALNCAATLLRSRSSGAAFKAVHPDDSMFGAFHNF